mgnify:CR=1 FL=1
MHEMPIYSNGRMVHNEMKANTERGFGMGQSDWDVETLIVGATFAGIGYAWKYRKDALLVEREMTPGHEFLYAYKHGEDWDRTYTKGGLAAALQAELFRRNLLSGDGRAHLPGITPLLYRLIRDEQLPVRFMTETVSVERVPGGYAATLFDPSGLRTVRAKRIIDTTSACQTKPQAAGKPAKRINALLHADSAGAGGPAPRIEEAAYRVEPGRYASEAYLSLPLEAEDTWVSGREKLHAFWVNRPEALSGWTLASVADQFDMTPPKGTHVIEEHWLWFPSAAFANPLAAVEAACESAEGVRTG